MLVDLQVKGGKITDRETYKQGILAREENGSTAVGEGIAILHAKNAAVKAPSLAAMTIPDGVDYEALDDEPSNLLFMIAAPSDGGDVHLEVLSRLMVILMDEDFRAKLLAAESKETFLQAIQNGMEAIVDGFTGQQRLGCSKSSKRIWNRNVCCKNARARRTSPKTTQRFRFMPTSAVLTISVQY